MRMHVLGSLAKPAALGLVLGLAGTAGLGCSTDQISFTGLEPEGPPYIKQVFLWVHDTDGNALLSMAQGTHREWPAEDPMYPTSKDRVIAYGDQKIRLVIDELLVGSTIEQFVCGCAIDGYTEAAKDPEGYCDGGVLSAIDPSFCPDSPLTTWSEAGEFLDFDRDGTPDDALLIPGIATITCGSVFTWENAEQDGWWWVSGNQVLPLFYDGSGFSSDWQGLGPAIVLFPPMMPTGTQCSLALAEGITDKQGEPLADPPFEFSTEPLTMWAAASAPQNGATGVALNQRISLSFNAPLADLDDGDATVTTGGVDVAGNWVAQDDVVQFTATGGWYAETTYDVTITTGVTDTFGVGLPEEITFSFTTVQLAVVKTTPADAETGVAVDADITIEFNALVTAAAGDVTVEDDAGTAVTGTITADGTTKTVVFTPDAPLAYDTAYTVTVTTGVTAVGGAALPAEVTFTFTTAAAP